MRVKVKIRIKYIPQFKCMYVYVCVCVYVFMCMLNVILLHIANYACVCV